MGNDDCGRRERSSADGPYYVGSLAGSNIDLLEADGRSWQLM